MIAGICDLTSASVTASTTANFACTSATGVRSADKLFVMATSSLVSPGSYSVEMVNIRAASSTIADQINVDISNLSGADQTVAGTLNFWAIR